MAGADHDHQGEGAVLLRRLKRLQAQAGAADAGDRARLIALVDDIEKVRRRLLGECARLDDELKRAAVRATAINAYARGARSARLPPRRGH
jgi:hypothetical protein